MTHLTTTQIHTFIDGTADYAAQAAAGNHLAVCAQCRREVEFQRVLLRTARKAPVAPPSPRFTERVMGKVLPRKQSPLAAWILNNMGGVFAMLAVLGVIGAAVMNPGLLNLTSQETGTPAAVQDWMNGLSAGYSWLSHVTTAAVQRPTTLVGGRSVDEKLLVLSGLTVLVLILADKFIFARVFRRKL